MLHATLPFLQSTLDHAARLDDRIGDMSEAWGVWFYLILFVCVFCECGILAAVFLPGDSLLITAGVLTATEDPALSLAAVIVTATVASILGYSANYWQGAKTGPRIFQREDSRFFKKRYLLRTQTFFEKHGAKTILVARFVAYVRTFAPFVAGMGRMPFWPFTFYSVIGAIFWSVMCVLLGHYAVANPFVLSLLGKTP